MFNRGETYFDGSADVSCNAQQRLHPKQQLPLRINRVSWLRAGAFFCLLSAANGASAAITSVSSGDGIAFAGTAQRGAFSEQFDFNLSDDSVVDGVLFTSLTNMVSLSFKSIADATWTTIETGITPNSFTTFSLSGAALSSGDYLFQIAGIGLGSPGSNRAFAGTLSVAPVPEPEMWAMIGIGSLLIGYQLKRSSRVAMANTPMLS